MFTIRRAKLNDLPTLTTLRGEFYSESGYPFDAATARAAAEELMRSPRFGAIWVIRLRDEPVGYAVVCVGYSLEYGGRDAFLDEIYVRDECRHHGAASQALDVALDWCRKSGVRAVHLEVEDWNEDAIRLYEDWEFEDNDRVLMTRQLTGKRAGRIHARKS